MTRLLIPGFMTLILATAFPHNVVQAEPASCVTPSSYRVTELPGLGGPVTQAHALNDAGQPAGWALDASWTTRAVKWNGSVPTNLSGSAVGAAQGISSDGRVAGWQSTPSGQQGAVWSTAGLTLLRPVRLLSKI